MLSRIDRYILGLFIGYFIGSLAVFCVIFLTTDFMGTFSKYDVATPIMFAYYTYYLPEVIHQLVPVSALVGTVFTLANLNRSNELVALFSLGFSLARVSAPILGAVMCLSMLNLWMADRILPNAIQKKKYIYYVSIKKKPSLYATVKTDKIWYRIENSLFNIQTLDPANKRAQGLTLYYFDQAWNLVQLIYAKNVQMEGERWSLNDGSVTLFTEDSSFPLTQTFGKKTITMSEDLGDLQNSGSSAELMSVGQLKRFIQRHRAAGLDTIRYEVDYHAKFSFGLAALVMSLIGIPFSVSNQRSGNRFLSFGICMGLAFFYWILYSSSLTMGKHESVPPIVAAWAPNVLLGALSLFFLVRLKK